jgi:hypothetical protein
MVARVLYRDAIGKIGRNSHENLTGVVAKDFGGRIFPSTQPHKKDIVLFLSGRGTTRRRSLVASRSVRVRDARLYLQSKSARNFYSEVITTPFLKVGIS